MEEGEPYCSTKNLDDNGSWPKSSYALFGLFREIDSSKPLPYFINLLIRVRLIVHMYSEIESLGVGTRYLPH